MIAWPAPTVPDLPRQAGRTVSVHDTATDALRPVATQRDTAGVYVCGITPYDATHLGHAATYLMVDLLVRTLRDSGREVTFVQNVTDVDDPLIERARRDGLDWRDLATREIQLFRDDMEALRVIPPQHYVGVVESVELIAADVAELLASGAAYRIGTAESDGEGADDVYLDLQQRDDFGRTSRFTHADMDEVFADRGGDPDREGKRTRFDPLLWRAARDGEPAWEVDGLPQGRPGWHIECSAIAAAHLGERFDVQAGGTDLVFPHHEMSAVQAAALHGDGAFADAYLHQAMVALDGEKMSKSKGNLVLVSKLRREGVDPAAIRLAVLAHHYATPWEWTDEVLDEAKTRLGRWREAAVTPAAGGPECGAVGTGLLARMRGCLDDDLDGPGAIAHVDRWIEAGADAGELGGAALADIVDATLGVQL
ncbi:MAG: cysteine--1-D-myo-inosityl 2-amino-2-deoxy-alpha-D-glucopyranoside ligase [Mobilicoccus sp.]|nr:cysteine--1-D-myo-inosityl 2-amino-2-deoxy-alpha-D-glucopyranoside ligase [Mobilicoccus sp.]